jgi:hypothetical protein
MMRGLIMERSNGRKKVSLFLVGCVFLVCLQGAPICQSRKTEGTEKKSPLRYRLIVSNPSVCQKDGISLELEIQNTSDHRVTIDRRLLLYQLSISRTGGATGFTGDIITKITQENAVELAPDQSYRKTVPYTLKDRIFSVVGLYTVQVTYGQFADPFPSLPDLYQGVVESNRVLFEIKNCDSNNP